MQFLPIIYLTYMFISIYFLCLYLIIYVKNRNKFFDSPQLKKHFSVSVLIPCYNEEDAIEGTIKSVFESDYDNIQEVIAINDGSKDNTLKLIKKLMQKYPKLKLLDKQNSGKADSINQALKIAKGELIAIVDSDSFPKHDAIRKLVGFFEDEKVGAATCPILARNRNSFFEKLQAIEYSVIATTRKMLEFVDAIYVTPGPLALYRKTALKQAGGFDTKNLTEDIEITWHLTKLGWDRKMCMDTYVTTIVPSKVKAWFRQRIRWSIGGQQTLLKYKSQFLKTGMLGYFILPLFTFSTFLGLIGLSIFTYLIASRLIDQYLIIKFSALSNTAILTLDRFYFTPSVLNYLGIVLFIAGLIFTILVLFTIEEEGFIKKYRNLWNILMYMIFYLSAYPTILVIAIFKMIRKDIKW